MICNSVDRMILGGHQILSLGFGVSVEGRTYVFECSEPMTCNSMGRRILRGEQILILGLGRYGKAKSFILI